MRIAALASHPIQYFSPLFRWLAQQPGVELTVFFCSHMGVDVKMDAGFGREFAWDTPQLDGYRAVFLPALQADRGPVSPWRPLNPGVVKAIRQGRFDVLWVHGHFVVTNWLAMLAAKRAGVKVLLRSESNLESVPNSALKRVVKRWALRLIFKGVDGCLYIGTKNREYYRYYGIPQEKLFAAPYVVDNAFFQTAYASWLPRRIELRARFGILDERPVILFVGKLIPKKQPLLLLEAFAKLRKQVPCALLIAGDGPLRSAVEAEIASRSIPDVILSGFMNQTEIAQAYTAGDIFVLPSAWQETWGLVVNEAMNFSLPIVVSDRVGCGPDLVGNGENGFIFPSGSSEALAQCLSSLVSDSNLRQALAAQSLRRIHGWGLKECVEGITHATRVVTGEQR